MRLRRGSALTLVLIVTAGLGALAMSAAYLSSSGALVTRLHQRDQGLEYAAEAGLALGRSLLNNHPGALPDDGVSEITMDGGKIPGVDPEVTVKLYAGQMGFMTNEAARFASIVADAQDSRGGRVVRRLEMAQESFARFAYFSEAETLQDGSPIYFAPGDHLWGPVWSNDVIRIMPPFGGLSKAAFHDLTSSAKTIEGTAFATFDKGYRERQRTIKLPGADVLARYPAYAASGGFRLQAPNSGTEKQVKLRVEFVAVDVNGDGDSMDDDEGFVRIYESKDSTWLRGDLSPNNCGDWHRDSQGRLRFYPVSAHNATAPRNEFHAPDLLTTLRRPNARCFPGGDPHLAGADDPRNRGIGGDSVATFYATGTRGSWRKWNGPKDPRVRKARPRDFEYLHPLHRNLNEGSRGVISVNGTVAVSGTLTGRVTFHSNANVVIIDDLIYSTDPASQNGNVGESAPDILGIIAEKDVIIADNAILGPADIDPRIAVEYRLLDDSQDARVMAVVMALGTSWRVENYWAGPRSEISCQGVKKGRGCLALTGGLIQRRRGAVGTSSGSGYGKMYMYDRRAATNPPPFFPTTGRFTDNRYAEVDPVGLDIEDLFARLTPTR